MESAGANPALFRLAGLHRRPEKLCHRQLFAPTLRNGTMRIEIENIVDEIKQAISLLRRHL
jgi:hypothetical protein